MSFYGTAGGWKGAVGYFISIAINLPFYAHGPSSFYAYVAVNK